MNALRGAVLLIAGMGLVGIATFPPPAAREGAVATALMTRARSGRASYVSADRLAGHVDPGAEAVARVFEALRRRAP